GRAGHLQPPVGETRPRPRGGGDHHQRRLGPRRSGASQRRAHAPAPLGAPPPLAQPAAWHRGLSAADAWHGCCIALLRRLPDRAQRTGAGGPRPSSRRPGQPDLAMREVLDELNEWTREGEDIALATVVETWGSSPRPLGSKMLVT